jgi:hypothetical protein
MSIATREQLKQLRTNLQRDDIPTLIKKIDAERSRLAKLLRSQDPTALTTRLASGEWSAIENVRHLLFAEQLHLGKFLPGKTKWNRAGLSGRTGKAYADVGTEPSDDLEVVLNAWNDLHRPIRNAVRGGDEEVRQQLIGNLLHMHLHVGVIKGLLER